MFDMFQDDNNTQSERAPLIMGVYRVYDACSPDGECFVGFSRNVAGTIKRLRFELTLNACSYKLLQQFYASCKDPRIEIYDTYSPENADSMSDTEIDAHLYAKTIAARTKLGENTHLIQTPGALNI